MVLFSVYFLQHFFLTSVFICKKGLLSFTSMVQVTVITGNFYRIKKSVLGGGFYEVRKVIFWDGG